MWLAPNIITLTGFLLEVFSFLVSFITSHQMRDPVPTWVCFLNGVCLLVYQTLDNLDGRQARRTGNSSPLGQFFDHGCDAVTGVCELMKVAATLGMGASVPTFFFVFMMGIGFSMTSYEEYVTHSFFLGYINGPDEGLFFLGWLHILCVFDTERVWGQYLVNPVTYVIFCLCTASTVVPILYNVVKESLVDGEKARRAIIGIVPTVVLTVLFIANAFSNTFNFENPYFIMAAGLAMQFTSQITIVAYLVLRQPQRMLLDPLWDAVVVFALFGFVFTEETWAYYYWIVVFMAIVLIMLFFDIAVIHGLSTGLGIPVFKIRPQEVPEDANEAQELPIDIVEVEEECDKIEEPLAEEKHSEDDDDEVV